MIEAFIAVGVIGLICCVGFKLGKQIGSRKGNSIGRAHARRRI